MKKEYTSAEQFMMDIDFERWVLNPQPQSDLFWKTWMKSNPDHLKELLLAKELILKLEHNVREPSQEGYDRVLENVLAGEYSMNAGKKDTQSKANPTFFTYLKVAAVLALAGFLYLAYISRDGKNVATQELSKVIVKENPAGRKSQVFLPDGSVVWLNSQSRIEYDSRNTADKRIVRLKGEAFFDVAKDESRPFVVETSNCAVTALGTQFNVKAYAGQGDHTVSLSEGKVMVYGKYRDGEVSEKVFLDPGQAISVLIADARVLRTTFDPKEALGWKSGTLYFKDASFPEVVDKLERWYGKKFVVTNSSNVGAWKFDSEFQDETLENVLRTISYAKGFEYKIENETVKLIF